MLLKLDLRSPMVLPGMFELLLLLRLFLLSPKLLLLLKLGPLLLLMLFLLPFILLPWWTAFSSLSTELRKESTWIKKYGLNSQLLKQTFEWNWLKLISSSSSLSSPTSNISKICSTCESKKKSIIWRQAKKIELRIGKNLGCSVDMRPWYVCQLPQGDQSFPWCVARVKNTLQLGVARIRITSHYLQQVSSCHHDMIHIS